MAKQEAVPTTRAFSAGFLVIVARIPAILIFMNLLICQANSVELNDTRESETLDPAVPAREMKPFRQERCSAGTTSSLQISLPTPNPVGFDLEGYYDFAYGHICVDGRVPGEGPEQLLLHFNDFNFNFESFETRNVEFSGGYRGQVSFYLEQRQMTERGPEIAIVLRAVGTFAGRRISKEMDVATTTGLDWGSKMSSINTPETKNENIVEFT